MAIARCIIDAPKNRKKKYTHYVEPLSHPNSGLICGKRNCNDKAYIFLDDLDYGSFNNGARIFGMPGTEQAKLECSGHAKLKQNPNTVKKPNIVKAIFPSNVS